MGNCIEEWRVSIGRWSGGRLSNCVKLQKYIDQASNNTSYMKIRFLLLLSLLVIGCVELNPGPDPQTPGTSKSDAADLKFRRRPGTDGIQGKMYERKMAAFLFARALHKTEEFRLAANVDGLGNFDDLVFRYRLKDSDIWETCFIQLKHKEKAGTIKLSSLIKMSGDFSLFEYFESYCQIKRENSTEKNLKHYGPFNDFQFVIYTNAKIKTNLSLQTDDSDTLNILSSGTNCGQYITFDEAVDREVFQFFKDLSKYKSLLVELEKLFVGGTFVCSETDNRIKRFQDTVTNRVIKDKVQCLKSNLSKDGVDRLTRELGKCDFTLYKEFLSKVQIFHSQSNEKLLKVLIEKELSVVCKASLSVAKTIYTKFEEGFSKWWERVGNVVWLSENAQLWQDVVTHVITEINEISEPEPRKFEEWGIRFSEQHIQGLCDAIKHNTFLNVVTNSDIRYLHKLKTYQALNYLGYNHSLYVGLKSLMARAKEILKLWPSKWSAALVIDCDCDGNVADILSGILQKAVGCEQELEISDGSRVERLVAVLKKYEQMMILISTRQHINFALPVQEKVGNTIGAYEDNCDMSDLDAESQRQILQRTVDFQGIEVTLDTLVGTDHLECIKPLVDSDLISILLSNEHKLCVGRQLSDLPKHYVPRVLQHHIYLKEDILKQTHKTITFAVSGLQTDELKNYLPVGEKICEYVDDERERSYYFKIASDFFMIGHSTERNNMKVKKEEVRYIILGNKNPESKFADLKALLANVHWILVEEGSFLWRDSNCDIDIIRRYIDETKCRNYVIESIMEQSDRTMLLVGEPGMGKSTFLSHMEHEIKDRNKSVWVVRINLNEHTQLLADTEFEDECIDKCKMFLWKAACSPEQRAAKLVEKIFLQALEQTGKMVIILDGFDEICPDYTPKVNTLILTIRDKTASQIFVSSRFSYRQNLENILIKLAFTLQPFSLKNQIEFLNQYWNKNNEISKQENLRIFAKMLLKLCSKNFSDKDGEFTCIPLQIMMLGEAFVKEAEEYCSKDDFELPEDFDLLDLFSKFWEKKCHIYFSEKNETNTSKPKVINEKVLYFGYHMIAAIISLFSQFEQSGPVGKIDVVDLVQTSRLLQSGSLQQFGIIRGMTNGKPHFIHRCFAEYFAANWFTDNFKNCKDFISDTLFNSIYEVTRNIFDRMLAKGFKIHCAVLNNDISAVEKFLNNGTDINREDKGGRTALHLAASYNRPVIQKLLTCQVVKTNILDKVLQWTPIRYAYRTSSWMAMDILLKNGANPDGIVVNSSKSVAQECGKEALYECASKGHRNLLEFMLNRGTEVNALLEFPNHFEGKSTLLHIASYFCQTEVINYLLERGADINMYDDRNRTAIHNAAVSGSVEIIKILLDEGMSVNLTDIHDCSPLHYSANCGHIEATKTLVESGAAVNNISKDGQTPLQLATRNSKSEIVRYLTERGANINTRGFEILTVLHSAAMSGSVEIIKILLDKGMSVNLTDILDNTPLHYSAKCGHMEATKTLVESGAALDKVSKQGSTPLHLAARNSKLEIFRYLTERGANINVRDFISCTALHVAAISGSVEIIKILLDKGMSVNLTNNFDWTPLHFSAYYGHMEATKTLVESGAALNNINKYGAYPLHAAAVNGNSGIFRYLIERGANINIRGFEIRTVLHCAASSGSVEIIKILLDKGMSVNLTDIVNCSPLHYSAYDGHMEATKTLIERGANINIRGFVSRTVLHFAAMSGSVEIIKILLDKGMSVNMKDRLDCSPLHYSAKNGHMEATKTLIERGADINVRDFESHTVLHSAAMSGSVEIIKILLGKGMSVNLKDKLDCSPLHYSAENDHMEATKTLIERGANINVRDFVNRTVLHSAAMSGSVEIIKILLGKGMSVNLTNKADWTPLHYSANYGHMKATKTLVESGAALENVTKKASTPLHFAARNSKSEIFRYLTERGANINVRDFESRTVLHNAAFAGSVKIIKILLDKGMSVNLTDIHDWTPLHYSAKNGHMEATKTLVESGAALENVTKTASTPLHFAARNSKSEIFHYLTERGANINVRDFESRTVLHNAAFAGSVEIIKILLDKGMSVNLTDIYDWTPLHYSANYGHMEATKTLVESGAALNNITKNGKTPHLLAKVNGKLKIFHYLQNECSRTNRCDVQ